MTNQYLCRAYRLQTYVSVFAALKSAESFMAGFEGDSLQEGIDEKLAAIRAPLSKPRRNEQFDGRIVLRENKEAH